MTTDLAIRPDQHGFTEPQVDVIRRQLGIEDVPDEELALYFHQALRTGLDPFSKQCYLIARWNNKKRRHDYTVQTGIDGYRLIADRTGQYAGSDAPEFGQDDRGKSYAKVTVWKLVNGVRCPFSAIAYYDEYVARDKEDRPSGLWGKMPRGQTAKCAEALALRKAFPADLSGIYTHEEMQQADSEASADVHAQVRKIPPYAVNKETGELETVEAVNEVPYVHQQRQEDAPGVREAQAAKAHPDDPDFEELVGPSSPQAGQAVGEEAAGQPQPHDEPPVYAPGPGEGPPAWAELVGRIQATGTKAVDFWRQTRTDAEQQGIRDVPTRTGNLREHPQFHAFLSARVDQLEADVGAAQQEELS